MGKEEYAMKKIIGLSMIMIAFLSCVHRQDSFVEQDSLVDLTCPVSNQDLDTLFNGIDYVLLRHGKDNNGHYCFVFQNGRRCLINYEDNYFVDVEESGVDSIRHSLTKEHVFFEERYGCNVEQLKAVIFFCSENNFYSVQKHDDDTHSYTCRTYRSIFFYSKDTSLYIKGKYIELGNHWYTPRKMIEIIQYERQLYERQLKESAHNTNP